MKALVCKEPFQLNYCELEMPVAKPGETLLKIERIGICGTDLHAFEGTQPFFNYPRVLGHELAATIVDTAAPGFQPGETVTVMPYFYCGKCIACRTGKENCCSNLAVFGVHIDGGMKAFVVVPDSALLKGGNLSFEELALVEPLAIGAHAVKRAAVMPGEFVMVCGAGPIGLGTMQFAAIAGGTVIAVDTNQHRLNFCRDTLGIVHTINPLDEDINHTLKAITGGDMPQVIIDATGNRSAINNAFQYAAHGARYVLVGLQKETIQFSHPEFHKREMTLMSSRNANRTDFDHVIDCIGKGLINPGNFITHRVKFEEVQEQFPHWLDPAAGVIKVSVQMD